MDTSELIAVHLRLECIEAEMNPSDVTVFAAVMDRMIISTCQSSLAASGSLPSSSMPPIPEGENSRDM
jgi:hypothetical protein